MQSPQNFRVAATEKIHPPTLASHSGVNLLSTGQIYAELNSPNYLNLIMILLLVSVAITALVFLIARWKQRRNRNNASNARRALSAPVNESVSARSREPDNYDRSFSEDPEESPNQIRDGDSPHSANYGTLVNE